MAKLRARAAGVTNVTDILEISEPIQGTVDDEVAGEEISKRAYELWLERGCPEGSPEEDWFQAQFELENRRDSR